MAPPLEKIIHTHYIEQFGLSLYRYIKNTSRRPSRREVLNSVLIDSFLQRTLHTRSERCIESCRDLMRTGDGSPYNDRVRS